MATKRNELYQAMVDAEAEHKAEQRALATLESESESAKASLRTLLRKRRDHKGSDEEAAKLDEQIKAAEAGPESFAGRVAAQKKLTAEAEATASAARKAYEAEDEREKAAAAKGGESLPDVEVGKDNREDKPFSSLGEQLVAVRNATLQPRNADPRLFQAAASGLSSEVPSDGGFLVHKSVSSTILSKVYEVGQLLQRVFRIPIGDGFNGTKIPAIEETSRADGSRYGGVQGYWVAAATAPTATKPKLRQIELELRKVAALVYATDELVQDAAALEALVMRVLPEELNFKVEDAIVNGTGSGMPLGYVGSGAVVSVAKETNQAAATINFDNVSKMWSRMWARSRASAVWLINQDCEPQLFGLSKAVGTGGVPVWLPANGLQGSPFSTLFGRPVIPVEYCATLGTQGDIQLVDLSQYALIDKGGVRAEASMHVRFIQDEMTYRFLYRVDGQPLWDSPLTPKNGSNTLSPFVVLDTRS